MGRPERHQRPRPDLGGPELQNPALLPFSFRTARALPTGTLNLKTRKTTMALPTAIPKNDLAAALGRIGLTALAENPDDFLARAIKGRWSPQALLEEICQIENRERARCSLERRLQSSRIGRFRLTADFEGNWPAEIDRELIERSLTLEFVREGRNLALVGNNGLGKTMIAKNIAHTAVLPGYSVLFRSAADIASKIRFCTPRKPAGENCAPAPGPYSSALMKPSICPGTATPVTCAVRLSIAATNNVPFSLLPDPSKSGTRSSPMPPALSRFWTA